MNTFSMFVVAAACAAAAVPAQDRTREAQELLARLDALRLPKEAAPDRAHMSMRGRYDLVVGRPKELKLQGPMAIWFDGARIAAETDYHDWGVMRRGVDAELVWESHPAFGATIYRGADADVLRRCYGFLRYTGWRDLYVKAERTGEDTIDGKRQHVLAMSPREGKPDTWYLDQDSGLLTRVAIELPGGMGTAQITLGDWKKVDGVLYAHREQTVAGSATGVVIYEQIQHGATLEPAKFEQPAAIKELLTKGESGGGNGCRVDMLDEQHVATIRMVVQPADIQKQLAIALPEVMAYVMAEGIETAGPPFTRFHDFARADGALDLECGLPVKKPIAPKGRIRATTLPGGRVASTFHIGSYAELPQSYERLKKWMAEQKLEAGGAPWEIYWTDPGLEQDPKKWRTQIVWPLPQAK